MKIIPSVMAKNQKELDELLRTLRGVSASIHLDVVDGKFASNKSLMFPFRLRSGFRYNVHLMVEKPEKWIATHGQNVNLCIVQLETLKDILLFIQMMKKSKKKIAIALKPSTSVAVLKPYIHLIDYALVLTVKPGFYGSTFLARELRKVNAIKKMNPNVKVFVDGHMNPKTIGQAVKAGADVIISGSYVTLAENPKRAMKELHHAARFRD